MIELIKIKNYALIEDSEIELETGLNVISGETGAGKSLFINALSLIIGEKVSSQEVVGKNGKEAIIEAVVKINSSISEKLKKINLEIKDSSFLIKRVIGEKNRCYVNNNIVSQSQLKELMEGFLDICSQHENQSLLNKNFQRELLDKNSNIEKELEEIKETFRNIQNIKKEIKLKESLKKENELKKDYFEFQLNEINSLNITKEDEKIEESLFKLKNSVKIQELESIVKQNLFSNQGVKSLLKESFLSLKELDSLLSREYSNEFKEQSENFIKYLDSIPKSSITIDEELVNFYIKRDEEISKIKRKYGNIIDILNKKEELEKVLDSIENFDSIIEDSLIDLKDMEEKYKNIATKISKKRNVFAEKISNLIEKNLKELNMPYAKFKIVVSKGNESEYGSDNIDFLISPNRGEDLDSLDKIASGGELSRVILAIYSSSSLGNKTFLFDEVDSGIGGDTASMVGQKLKSISSNNQIICITHLPQVAVFGNENYKIEKIQDKTKTISKIFKLDEKSLVNEIARMLGSSINELSALNHAKEMVKIAKSNK